MRFPETRHRNKPLTLTNHIILFVPNETNGNRNSAQCLPFVLFLDPVAISWQVAEQTEVPCYMISAHLVSKVRQRISLEILYVGCQ